MQRRNKVLTDASPNNVNSKSLNQTRSHQKLTQMSKRDPSVQHERQNEQAHPVDEQNNRDANGQSSLNNYLAKQ
jgi:hypothetical protein